MAADVALRAADGYGTHLESGLQWVTLCGRVLAPGETTREPYSTPEAPDHPHTQLCFDCHTVANGGSVDSRRRATHFDSAVSS